MFVFLRVLLAELERHQDAWPFLTPVNLKSVPGYRKVIKKPMDFFTIREKLVSSQYVSHSVFKKGGKYTLGRWHEILQDEINLN